jgi:demethylmenaquinone methyltransferase/2-methoxy-6-polyprenyl-1,4-benzoquinol methylase
MEPPMPAKYSPLKIRTLDLLNPEDKLSLNKRLFTVVAPVYRFVTIALSFGRDSAWKRKLIQCLPAMKNPQCLDLACGMGDIAYALAEKYPGGSIIGLDINEKMLASAKTNSAFSNLRFVLRDMSHTGFENDRFDVITGGYALRNAPNIPETLNEIFRILRPGGHCAMLDFSKSHRPWLQSVSLFFLTIWGGLWGLILHGNPDIYTYIAKSLQYFPDRAALKGLLAETGFKNISSRLLFLGLLEIVTFEK